jgi:hypothetical protein
MRRQRPVLTSVHQKCGRAEIIQIGTYSGRPAQDVLITVDANLRSQQNFKKFPWLSVILLVAENTDLKTLITLEPRIKEALRSIKPGQFMTID